MNKRNAAGTADRMIVLGASFDVSPESSMPLALQKSGEKGIRVVRAAKWKAPSSLTLLLLRFRHSGLRFIPP